MIGIVECPRLALYSTFLTRKGYALTRTPGTDCSVLIACPDHLGEETILRWGQTLEAPKIVLGGNAPLEWRHAERLELPVLPLNLEQRILELQEPLDPRSSGRTYDVVVVDDDATIREAVESALITHGLRVRGCGGFADLTAALLKNRPDFILLDLNLPGISGESVGNVIRGRKIPTAVFSSAPIGDLRQAQEKIGAVTAFSKTTSLGKMAVWIRHYLDRQAR